MTDLEGKPARRWLGPRGGWWLLLIGCGILGVYFTVNALFGPRYTVYRELPVSSLALGALLAATCVFYTMLYRLRPEDGVTIARLFAALGVAAFITTFLAGQANGLIAHWADSAHVLVGTGPGSGGQISVVSTLFAGPVEETIKALTVLLLGIGLKAKTFRGGLFLGGAVGLGFAALEDLLYFTNAWEHPILQFSQLGTLAITVGLRTVLTPLLHPIFTSLIGGLLFAASRNGRYRLSVPLVGTYLAVLGVHSLWDSLGAVIGSLRDRIPTLALGGLSLLALVLLLGIAIGLPFVWRTVARRANVLAGLRPPPIRRTPAPPYFLPPGPPPPAGWKPPDDPAITQ